MMNRRAYSLAEMVASLSVVSVLLLGMGSAVLISTSAVPAETSNAGLLGSSLASTRLTDDLAYAIMVVASETRAVECLIPDRDADGMPERVRYEWTGTPGDPLTRSLNGGDAVTILEDVQTLAIGYDRSTTSQPLPGPTSLSETAERLLLAYSPDDGASQSPVDLYQNELIGQSFLPFLTSDVVAWSVTHVRILAEEDKRNGSIECTLQTVNADLTPTGTVLATQTVTEADFSNPADWLALPFANVDSLDPTAGLALVLDPDRTDIAIVHGHERSEEAGMAWLERTGVDWWTTPDRAMEIEIYGTTTHETRGTPLALVRDTIQSIDLSIQTGRDASGQIDHQVKLVNEPTVLSACWATTFDKDPSATDHNADGVVDFSVHGAGSLSDELTPDAWAMRTVELRTAPEIAFDEPTAISVEWQDSNDNGSGGVLMIAPDWQGSSAGQVIATIDTDSRGTTVAVELLELSGTTRQVAAAELASGATSRLDLVVDPVADTLSVTIDGVQFGTFAYGMAPSIEPRALRLFAAGSTAGTVVEMVSVSVGGTVVTDATGMNTAPVAVASASAAATTPGTALNFDASASSDADGDAIVSTWDFGDGSTATGTVVTHAFSDSGSFPVTLTVSDGSGSSSSDTVFVTVTDINGGGLLDGLLSMLGR